MHRPVERNSTAFIFLPFVKWVKLFGLSLNVHTARNRVSVQKQVIQNLTVASSRASKHHLAITVRSLTNQIGNTPAENDSNARELGKGFKGSKCRNEFQHHRDPIKLKTPSANVKKGSCWFLEKLYSLVVLLLVWFSFGWIVAIFAVTTHQLEDHLLPLVVILTWTAQSSVISTIFYGLGFSDWLSNMFSLLDVSHCHAVQAGLKPEELFLKLKRHIHVATAAIIVSSLVLFGGEYYAVSCIPDSLFLSFVPPKLAPFYTSQLWLFVFRIGLCFSVLLWVHALVLIAFFLHVFGQHFRFLADAIKSNLFKDEDDFYFHLKSYRGMYQSLADVVHGADKYLRFIFGIHCVVFILAVIFALYALAKINNSLVTAGPTLIGCFVLFGTVMLQCGILYEQAKAPLHALLRVQSASSSLQHAEELRLFILTVIHGEVGITVLDLFFVDKNAILTIFGVVVSYFFVAIQWNY